METLRATAKNRRNRSHVEVKNYLLFATELSRSVKKSFGFNKDFDKRKKKIYKYERSEIAKMRIS